MKVFLIGANGQVGKHIVTLLQNHEKHTVKAMVRNKEQAEALKQAGVETIVADLEGSVDDLAEAMANCDAVVFSAGSGSKTGPDKTLLVDLDGAVKSMEAAEQVGIDRYVMVSAFKTHDRKFWKDSKIKPYMVAKHYADRILSESDLNYTILGPGLLLNEPGTGKVIVGDNIEKGSIAREDVAKTVVASLDERHTFRKTFGVMSGDMPIKEALKNLE